MSGKLPGSPETDNTNQTVKHTVIMMYQSWIGTVIQDMVIFCATVNKYNNLAICKFYRYVTKHILV
jgi:hypothetical protein